MNYDKKTIRDIDVSGKKILLRCDFNVPHDKATGIIHDDTRIVSTLPTIRYLLEHNAAVILLSHMGRPHGEWKKELSLFSARDHLEKLLGLSIPLTKDVLGPDTKAKCAALDAGLRPILCVGEDLEQRELGVTLEFISYQLKAALAGVTPEEMRRVVIAYEPIWAIGTGNTATPEQAGEVCAAIRGVLRKLYGARIARSTTIQYGGSMNAANAQDLLNQEDVDGGLIGTAALDVEQFLQIIQTANQDGPQP